jgi:hypothetical protein
VYSRDELKQFEMRQAFPVEKYPNLRFFLGDVRDRERLYRALDQQTWSTGGGERACAVRWELVWLSQPCNRNPALVGANW